MAKPRLSPENRKLVDRYKFLNSELDRYCGSVFYRGEGDPRENKMLAEQKDISDRLRSRGVNLDLYW